MKKVYIFCKLCCFYKNDNRDLAKNEKELERSDEVLRINGNHSLGVFDMIHDRNGNVLQSPTLGVI
jgi:hypothetical protein